jgi:hypothetical protein
MHIERQARRTERHVEKKWRLLLLPRRLVKEKKRRNKMKERKKEWEGTGKREEDDCWK